MALLTVGLATAECPPDCLPGGGPVGADCYVQFGDVAAMRASCVDGDATCDGDAAVDGACTFDLTVCVNMPDRSGCTPDAITGPTVVSKATETARTVAAALATLDPSRPACVRTAVSVAVRATLGGVRPASERLTIVAAHGPRRDRDRLILGCEPAAVAPSFVTTVAPIFAERCATPACHTAAPPNSSPVLEPSVAFAETVGAVSLNVTGMSLVVPDDVRASYLARKVLGRAIRDHTSAMPLGCPANPPPGGCLRSAERAAIIAWIARGAPEN